MKIKIKVKKPFSYAYEGIKIVRYAPAIHSVSERCAEVAVKEGWANYIKKAKKVKK